MTFRYEAEKSSGGICYGGVAHVDLSIQAFPAFLQFANVADSIVS